MAVKQINHNENLDPKVKGFVLSNHPYPFVGIPLDFKPIKRFPPALEDYVNTTHGVHQPVIQAYRTSYIANGTRVTMFCSVGKGTAPNTWAFKQASFLGTTLSSSSGNDASPMSALIEQFIPTP